MFEQALQQVLITISQSQQKLQTYRQLLNEQIQFNIKDLYMMVSGNSAQVTAFHLHVFMGQEEGVYADLAVIQSFIKGYNCCASMNLSFIQFALVFLSKENKLLAKLTIQRNSLGQIPPYLLTYTKKILQCELDLHTCLISFRKKYSSSAEQWIKQHSILNEQTGEEEFDGGVIENMCVELQIQKETVLRYFRVGDGQPIKVRKILGLFTIRNCDKVSEYLKKSAKTTGGIKSGSVDPFIRPQFHDCLQRPKTLQSFSHRQLKSIQKHLSRLNPPQKSNLPQKISQYRQHLQKQLTLFCEAINNILHLQNEIEAERIELCLCTDFYPVLFYDSFDKDRDMGIIPSALKGYLEGLGVAVDLGMLYVVFKRYSTRVDGKLHFNQFCSIFDVYATKYCHIERNRLVKTLDDVDTQTVKSFLKLLKTLIKNQLKIQKIKSKLQSQVNLRQIFSLLDQDEDGYISMLDFRVAWKKYLLMQLKEDKIGLLWHRMRLPRSNSMIKYEKFVAEMIPKSTWVDREGKKGTKEAKGRMRTTK